MTDRHPRLTQPDQSDLSDTVDDLPEDQRVFEVVEEYLADLDRNARKSRDHYLQKYPELSDAIGACLDGLDLVRKNMPALPKSVSSAGRAATATVGRDLPPNPLGDFQIVRELARGGMGIVYEATQLSLGRRVALKVLPFAATFDARQLQRFKNEAQAAALLHHSHIVPVYAVGCERGVHFYAMQLIDGQSLAVVIRQLRDKAGLKTGPTGGTDYSSYVLGDAMAISARRTATLPGPHEAMHSTADVSASLTSGGTMGSEGYFRRACRLMVQAAEALEHAHQLGVVHRDVKPANLLVSAAGHLWVTDFGLAQWQADTGLTRSGDLLGTFRYMSPEQTTGQRTSLDHRTDIYSLGATFYELLTLEPAFAGETRQELLYQIVYKEPRLPRSINRAIPAELETIVLKAMSKNHAERYATAAEFAADIQRYLDHQPILARRPTLFDRVRKWSRRHPSIVAAGVLLLAVVAIGMSISNRLIANEQQKTSGALDREKLRSNEAESRFQQARQAVDVMIQMSEEELADNPMAQGTRKRLLETALGFYEDFIAQRRGDAEAQAELAAVEERVRGILRELAVLQREMQIGFLARGPVQDDLGLTDEQKARLGELLKKAAEDRRASFSEGQPRTEAQRRRYVEQAEARERTLSAMLSPQQLQRLKQIVIQTQGLFAFKDPDIVKALKLTPEQRAAIRGIEAEIFASHGPRGPGQPPGPNMQPGPREDRGPRHEPRPEDNGPRNERRPEDQNDPRRDDPRRGNRTDNGPGEGFGPGSRGDMRWRPVLSRRESVEKVVRILNEEQTRTWRELTGDPSPAVDDPPFRGPPRF